MRIPKRLPTQEEYDAALAKSEYKLDRARAQITVHHPFFASIMLKHPMTPSLRVPTLGITARGHIYYNPGFLHNKSTDEVMFVVAHEILHYASGHAIRCGARDKPLWNIAGDMWINDVLKQSGFTLIPGVIDKPGSGAKLVEDIYASFPPPPPGGYGEGQGGPGDGDPIGDDIYGGELDEDGGEEGPLTESEIAEIEWQRKLDVAEAAQIAKQRGKLPGALAQFASETVKSKTPWHDILERYMTDHVQTEQSWTRPNRRYAPDFYVPTRDSKGCMGEVAIQVDISGSISKEEIAHYNGHLKRIVEQCQPAKVHVIYTDAAVQKYEVFEKPEDVKICFYSGGGTDMRAGINYVKKHNIDPVVFITLTDGYTPFPDKAPEFPTVWCISTKNISSPVGTNVHFELD